MKNIKSVKVKVWGDFACFTRPDLKVERMTYPCMTPAAARGVLEAILYKPEFIWHIRSIQILSPVKFFSVRRNEINKKVTNSPIVVDEIGKDGKPKNRVMRNSIVLRDVVYVIDADIAVYHENKKNHGTKYMAMFNRRVEKGQCYKRPYLGTREFSAEFAPVTGEEKTIAEDIPIGGMLLDVFYDETGKPQPLFFEAAVRMGVLDCHIEYESMLKSAHPKLGGSYSQETSNTLHGWNEREESEMANEGLL